MVATGKLFATISAAGSFASAARPPPAGRHGGLAERSPQAVLAADDLTPRWRSGAFSGMALH